MSACTFFGHRDCPYEKYLSIFQATKTLILEKDVSCFYVGTQGNFDYLVFQALCALKNEFPDIQVHSVLAYKPRTQNLHPYTVLPEGIELVHPRYAIPWRNRWMIDHSDYVIAYVTHNFGGAARFVDEAKRKGKTVINL